MPSDARVTEALRLLQPARQAFLSAVATAADGVRTLVAAHDIPAGDAAVRAARELGPFAGGRMNATRFAEVFGAPTMDASTLDVLRRSADLLSSTAAAGDDWFTAELPEGGDLHDLVGSALTCMGRAFGAARAADMARAGSYHPTVHAQLLEAYPPARWTRAERDIAPPLVVELDGAALRQVGALAEYLVGAQKIVLVVKGAAPPAALVRLITPGVLVMQVTQAAALTELAQTTGPAIAALVGPEAAAFVHAPARGPRMADRLALLASPPEPARVPLVGYSQRQQAEELAQLVALVAESQPAPAASVESAADAAEPADLLAAWLLKQVHLADVV